MKPKNYSKISENFKKSEKIEPVPAEELNPLATETVVEEPKEEMTEPKEPTLATGVVVGCTKLNVREQPSKDAKVLCIINKNDEVKVNLYHDKEPELAKDESYYKVITSSGVEGYCVVKYINVK